MHRARLVPVLIVIVGAAITSILVVQETRSIDSFHERHFVSVIDKYCFSVSFPYFFAPGCRNLANLMSNSETV